MRPFRPLPRTDLGFNRNIVECKSTSLAITQISQFSFNRNIVECKSDYVESTLSMIKF